MNPSPKINLSAMVKKKETEKKPEPEIIENKATEVKTEKVDIKTEETTEEKVKTKVDIPSLIPKISLSSIKTNKSVIEKKEENAKEIVDEHLRKKEELLEVLVEEKPLSNDITNKTENNSKKLVIEDSTPEKVVSDPEIKEAKITDNESLEEIEKKINEKVEEEVNKKIKKSKNDKNEEPIEVLDDKKELFWNYKSEFTEKENNIIEEVKTEKKKFTDRIKLPKTRVLLILVLILITIGAVWALFKIDPKNHSIDKYKTAITNNIKNIKKNYIDKEWVLEVTNIDWYNFDTYTQKKIFTWSNYKYKDIIYTSKTDLDQVINNELSILKQEAENKRILEENKKAEQARLAAEKARLEAEKIKTVDTKVEVINTTTVEQENKIIEDKKITKEKVRTLLYNKYKELMLKYQK